MLLWLESLAFYMALLDWVSALLLVRFHLPVLGVSAADFEPKRLFMRSVYLMVMACCWDTWRSSRSSCVRRRR